MNRVTVLTGNQHDFMILFLMLPFKYTPSLDSHLERHGTLRHLAYLLIGDKLTICFLALSNSVAMAYT